ncbi:hypothetical protein D3874_19270 [Oleomonas cavernae]|uniref:Lytic murein transglycosylase n=1 Tax=Oleomonas cavernae TaxID=2320859 RepID=A0A418WFQ7_9PROT|nr:hypothetical protein D3874_19270 [Oleomonas cavernae]
MTFRTLLLALGLTLPFASAATAAEPDWVQEWRALADKSGFEGHRKMAELLADPRRSPLPRIGRLFWAIPRAPSSPRPRCRPT